MRSWMGDDKMEKREKGHRMMKTLYISDLDGTLLRGNQRTSDFTNRVIAAMEEKGYHFSYAAARSIHTAKKATAGMEARLPLIVYNGAFIVENGTGKILLSHFFKKKERDEILAALLAAGVQPIVYAFEGETERMMYVKKKLHPAARDFMNTRKGDSRDTPVENEADLQRGQGFYFTCIDEEEKLEPLFAYFREKYHCVYAKDIYAKAQWLEIMPQGVSKANAIRQLKKLLQCERTVAFGDGLNDMDMFEMAEEAYAVSNAAEELKEKATAVIGSNEEDGVAKFLLERLGLQLEEEGCTKHY